MFCLIDRPGTDYIVSPAIQNRLYQFLYVICAVLIVRIRVHDDICTLTQALVQSCHKAFGKSLVLREVHDVVHTPFSCHLNCIVPASVIDDQIFDLVDAV